MTTTSLDNEEEISTEAIDNEEVEHPGLKQILGAELQELALVGIGLKKRIAEAKTAPKKKLYQKKLEKNSKKAAELILYLERLQITEAIEESRQQQEFIDIRNSEDDHAEGRASEEGEQ